MKLTLHGIADRGVPNMERVGLRVVTDTNVSYYVVLDTTYITPTSISTTVKNTFWFPPKLVKAGDWVVLFTKEGTASEKKLDDGSTAHYFFWGKSGALWNLTGNCAVVMELSDWSTSRYE